MVNNPTRTYGALLATVAVMISGTVIPSGFTAIDSILDTVTMWGYMAAVGVMIICTVANWLTNFPRILSSGFGSERQ